MTDEQRELMRIAAQRLLDDVAAGHKRDRQAVQWAHRIVSQIKPLGRPLGTGEPQPETLPPALRGGALEVF